MKKVRKVLLNHPKKAETETREDPEETKNEEITARADIKTLFLIFNF